MRQADPTRPLAGSWSGGAGDIDVAHNPIALADIARVQDGAKPLFWDEAWCIFQGIFGDGDEMWVDPGIRDFYAEPLPAVFAKMMQSTNIIGTQIWAWSDDIFCMPHRGVEFSRRAGPFDFLQGEYLMPERGLVGDAPWGMVDGWRRRKPEFWITKKLHSPVKIKEGALPLPPQGRPIRVAVENQYDFTDLSELTTRWQWAASRGSSVCPSRLTRTAIWRSKPRRRRAKETRWRWSLWIRAEVRSMPTVCLWAARRPRCAGHVLGSRALGHPQRHLPARGYHDCVRQGF